jgi:hypothetical protein
VEDLPVLVNGKIIAKSFNQQPQPLLLPATFSRIVFSDGCAEASPLRNVVPMVPDLYRDIVNLLEMAVV